MISSFGGEGCKATIRSGCPEKTMQGLQLKMSWNGNWQWKARLATTRVVRPLRRELGNGQSKAATRSCDNFDASGGRATGRENASLWMKGYPVPSEKFLCACTKRTSFMGISCSATGPSDGRRFYRIG